MSLKYLYVPSGYKEGKAYGVLPNEANADFAFVRASGATRVDSNGLIDKSESLGSNIEPTDFSSGWTGVGSGMTLSTGSAVWNYQGAYIETDSNITLGKSYRIVFEVTSFTSAVVGGLYYYSGNGVVKLPVDGVGTYEYTFTSLETRGFILNSYTGTTLTVGSVSLKEITTTNLNTPRLDYTDGSCPTLLTEPESTNIVQYSEDFGRWLTTVSGTGVAPVISTGFSAPDGSSNARKIIFDKGSGNTTNDICFVKDSYTSEVGIFTQTVWMRTESGTANVLMDFNSGNSNEVVVTTTWQRMTLTKSSSFTTDKEFRIGLRGGSSTDNSATILIWGAQLEKLEYATSYIPTYNTIQTRAADKGVVSGDLSSYINSSEGVLEIKAKALFNGGDSVRIGLSDGSHTNRINLIWSSNPNTLQVGMVANNLFVFDGGTAFFKSFTHDQTQMATFKIKWKSGDIQVKLNDTIVLTETHNFTILGLDQVRLDAGYGVATDLFEGNVQYIKVYDSITDF